MFPAQTSMMPVTVAIARFWAEGSGWYPYWYLGVPFRFLGGPIVPLLLVGSEKLLSQWGDFERYFLLSSIFWLLGGFSLLFLVKGLGGTNRVSFTAGLTFLLGPFLPFLFPFSDATLFISFSFLPLILLCYFRLLDKWSGKRAILTAGLTSIVLLIDNQIFPALLIGMSAIFLAVIPWERIERQLKNTVLILFSGFALATFWYTPSYWYNLWFAPSFSGKSLGSVLILLSKLLPLVIAAFLAFFSVRQFQRRKNLLLNFTLFWTLIFGFLTLMRFLADWRFWQDWTSYALELQAGGAILLAILVDQTRRSPRFTVAIRCVFLSLIAIIWLLPWVIAPHGKLGIRQSIVDAVEYQVGDWLSKNIRPEERVYLSGTTAFWLNSFFNINQVRGGSDQGAIHPSWGKASYEIREGTDGELAAAWLKALGVSYLVIHGLDSSEYYHDFKYPEKFQISPGFRKVWERNGDVIYKVEGARIARAVNLGKFRDLKPPRDGADKQSVLEYANQLGRPLSVVAVGKNGNLRILGEIMSGEAISLAVSYDDSWRVQVQGLQAGIKLEKDVLGNLLILLGENGSISILLHHK